MNDAERAEQAERPASDAVGSAPDIDAVIAYAARDVLPDREVMRSWSDSTELTYYRLREMYRQYRSKTITKEQGEKQKAEILRQHSLALRNAEQAAHDREGLLRQIRHHAKLWSRIEHAGTAYALSAHGRTAEGDALLEAVYGCRPKEVMQNGE